MFRKIKKTTSALAEKLTNDEKTPAELAAPKDLTKKLSQTLLTGNPITQDEVYIAANTLALKHREKKQHARALILGALASFKDSADSNSHRSYITNNSHSKFNNLQNFLLDCLSKNNSDAYLPTLTNKYKNNKHIYPKILDPFVLILVAYSIADAEGWFNSHTVSGDVINIINEAMSDIIKNAYGSDAVFKLLTDKKQTALEIFNLLKKNNFRAQISSPTIANHPLSFLPSVPDKNIPVTLFSKFGKFVLTTDGLATISDQGGIDIFDNNNKLIKTLGEQADIFYLANLPQNQVIAAAKSNVRIWDIQTEKFTTLNAKSFTCLKPSCKGDVVYTIEGNTIGIYDVKTGKLQNTFMHYDALSQPINPTSLLPLKNNEDLLISSPDGTVGIWNSEKGYSKNTLRYGKKVPIRFLAQAASGEAILAEKNTVYIWDMNTGKNTSFNLSQEISAIAASPNAPELVIALKDGSIETWDVSSFSARYKAQVSSSGKQPAQALIYKRDGRIIAGSLDGQVTIYPIKNDQSNLLSRENSRPPLSP